MILRKYWYFIVLGILLCITVLVFSFAKNYHANGTSRTINSQSNPLPTKIIANKVDKVSDDSAVQSSIINSFNSYFVKFNVESPRSISINERSVNTAKTKQGATVYTFTATTDNNEESFEVTVRYFLESDVYVTIKGKNTYTYSLNLREGSRLTN